MKSMEKGDEQVKVQQIGLGNLMRNIILVVLVVATVVLFISNMMLKNKIATLDKNVQFVIGLVNNDLAGQGEKLELLEQKVDGMTSGSSSSASSSSSK